MLSGHKQFKISQFYDTFTTNHEKDSAIGECPCMFFLQGHFFFLKA